MQISKLQDKENIEKFSNEIVEYIKDKIKIPSNNKYFSDKLLKHIRKGKNVKFNYDILLQCSKGV